MALPHDQHDVPAPRGDFLQLNILLRSRNFHHKVSFDSHRNNGCVPDLMGLLNATQIYR